MPRNISPLDVWQRVPVGSRLIEVNTKTGFSLTAGSYSIRASSNAQGRMQINAGTSYTDTAVSSVTLTRTVCAYGFNTTDVTSAFTNCLTNTFHLSSTAIRGNRYNTANYAQAAFNSVEYL